MLLLAEPEQDGESRHEITALTAEMVAANVGHDAVVPNSIPTWITAVGKLYTALGKFA